jgi:hypothetical protein
VIFAGCAAINPAFFQHQRESANPHPYEILGFYGIPNRYKDTGVLHPGW